MSMIRTIELQIGTETFNVSPKCARRLHKELSDLFSIIRDLDSIDEYGDEVEPKESGDIDDMLTALDEADFGEEQEQRFGNPCPSMSPDDGMNILIGDGPQED